MKYQSKWKKSKARNSFISENRIGIVGIPLFLKKWNLPLYTSFILMETVLDNFPLFLISGKFGSASLIQCEKLRIRKIILYHLFYKNKRILRVIIECVLRFLILSQKLAIFLTVNLFLTLEMLFISFKPYSISKI